MSQAVTVFVRFRPTKAGEHEDPSELSLNPAGSEVTVGSLGKRFTYDALFDGHAGNEDVFRAAALPLLDSVLQGYHGTILAYGQTGSGKTHTMMGPDGARSAAALDDGPHAGLVPRVMAELFARLRQLPVAEKKWSVQVTRGFLGGKCFFLIVKKPGLGRVALCLQPPSVTRQPPSVALQPPSVALHPPSGTLQPPSVTLQPPSVTLQPPSVIPEVPSVGAVQIC